MNVEITGTIAEIIYHNVQNGYTVAVVENQDQQFTAVGYLPDNFRGRTFSFQGTWKAHPSYGEQFTIQTYEEHMPQTVDAIENFLASGVIKGVGKKTASLMVSKFGEQTLEIIEREPNRLQEIEGIGGRKAEQIVSSYEAHREFATVTLFFQQYGISPGYAMKLYKTFGKDTVDVVSNNPYEMIDEVFGIGFKKADAIADKLGISKEAPLRITSGIEFGMWKYVNEGHTFVPKTLFCEKMAEFLEVSSELVNDTLTDMAFEGVLHLENIEDRTVIFLMPYFVAEQNVCKCLIRLNKSSLKPIDADLDSLIAVSQSETGIYLSENQRFAVKESLRNGVSLITGGPGTGKTTIINAIMKILTHCGLSTAIAAPTGRAAKRITETSGYEASTIHRLLEYYYSESEDAMRFGKNEEDPLEYDVVVIDEASMIDILLMNGVVNALKPGTRLILVGDADQLPSVGAGNVLRDILESEIIYSIRLKEIFRQAKESLIVVNAHKINKGEYPSFNEKNKDFFFLKRQGERETLRTVKELVERRLPNYFENCNVKRDVQILTPMRKGLLGMYQLNEELQKLLNPPSEKLEEKQMGIRTYREGDKVMQIKNNYQIEWKRSDDFTEGQGVFNGDVGYIHKIDKEFNTVTVVYEESKYVTYEFSDLDQLELAYAMTVHKSQGSEFPIVIMPISWFPPILATRNLLYTAVTRGKQAVILVGSDGKMNAMVDNNVITERYSGLKYRLRQFLEFG